MISLTSEQVLFLHARLIEETGGSHGVRDIGPLESPAARPQASFGGQDLYPDLPSKAAALMQSLAGNLPFVDGNRRTAVAAAGILLRLNGLRLMATNDALEEFALDVAQGRLSLEEIAIWFDAHTETVRVRSPGE